jgi:hypothetical protein
MVARHFGTTDELIALSTKDATFDIAAARVLIAQVEEANPAFGLRPIRGCMERSRGHLSHRRMSDKPDLLLMRYQLPRYVE